MRFRSIFYILFLIPALAFGQDSIPVLSRVKLRLSPSQYFLPFIWENPALAPDIRTFSTIDLSLSAITENNKNKLPQLGNNTIQGAFNADAQLRLKNNDYIWGKAFYKNGEQKNVQWNESADFLKVYPYVALDTIGGDLKYEQYYFQGGYAKDYENFSWGVSADFKEGMEYRDKDPRPKNLTSDLNAALGGAWQYSSHYILAANLNAGKYKQENDVTFFSEKGASPIYNAIGLGLLNSRFWSSGVQTYFSGTSYGGSLTILPRNISGFSANVQYNRSGLNKRITNPANIDLNRTITQTIRGSVSYLRKSERQNYGLNLAVKYDKKLGYESIVGDIVKGVYVILGENQPYKSECKHLSINGLFEKNWTYSWSVQPEFSAGELQISYASPHRLMQVSFYQPQLKTNLFQKFGKSAITLNLVGTYHRTFNEKLEIVSQTSGQTLENREYINDTFNSLTSNYTGIYLNAKYYYFHNKDLGIYLQASGEQRWYKQQLPNSNALFLALGVVF